MFFLVKNERTILPEKRIIRSNCIVFGENKYTNYWHTIYVDTILNILTECEFNFTIFNLLVDQFS